MAEQSAVLGLGSKIEAGTKQAFSAIADGFRQIAKAMSDSAASMRKVGQEAPAKIFEEAARSVNKVTDSLDKQITSTKMLSQAQTQAAEARRKGEADAAAAQAKSTAKLAEANSELEKTSGISAKAAAQLQILKAKFHDIINAPGSTGKSANNLLTAYIPKADDAGQLKVLEVQLQRLQASFRATAATASKSADTFQKLNRDFPGLEKQIRALDKTNLSYNEQITVLKRLEAAKKAAGSVVDKSASDFNKQSEGIQRLRKQYADLRLSTDRYGQAANKIIGNIRAHNIEINKASAALARLKQQQAAAEGNFTTLGGAVNMVVGKLKSYAGYMVASTAVFAFISGIREAITTIASYDQSLKDLQAITSPTQAELVEMGDTMKAVAGDTKFSAEETAEGMKLLGQAGLAAREVIDSMPGVTNLATGTMSDLSSVIDLTSTTMRAFGLAAKDTGYITDVFANAVNKSKLTIEDIKTAFNYIAPAAHNAGMSLDETARVMMILRDNGLKASSMATGFRRILAKLAIPTESFKKNIAEAGMSLEDFDVNALGISTVLHNLSKVVTTNKEAFEDFGIYGSAAVTALIKDVDKFDALAGTINRQGSAAEMAAIQMQGLENMFKNLQTKVQVLFITMGEGGLIGVLKALVNVARTAVDVITDLAGNGLVQFIVQATLALGATKLLVMALTWFKGTAFVTSAMSGISLGLVAVQSAMAAGTTSTYAMGTALTALKGIMMTFLPTAILTALGAMAYKTLTYTQSLKDARVELNAVSNAAEDNATSLSGTISMLEKGTVSQEQQGSVIDTLAKKYKNWGVELRNAEGDSEKLIEVLNKVKEAEDTKAKNALSQSMKATALQLEDNIKSQESWLTVIRNGIQSESAAEASKKKFVETNNSLIESMVSAAKRVGKTNEEIKAGFVEMVSAGMLGDQSDAILKRVEETLESFEKPAHQAGFDAGRAVTEGMEEGIDTDALSKKAEEFNKSVAVIDFKSANKSIEKELSQRLYQISVAEAQGVTSHEEAEMDKLDITMSSYDKMVDAAKAYAEAAKQGGTQEQQIEAQTKIDDAIERANQVRLQKLEALGKKRVALEDKISEQQNKSTEEQKKYDEKLLRSRQDKLDKIKELEASTALKITEITKNAVDKRLDAEREFEDKKKELVKARIEIERDAAADVAGLEDSLQDKITNIKMKGLDGQAKESAVKLAADERLAQGQQALAIASEKNDKDAIARAKELISSAGGYYDQLEDSGAAIDGLRAVTAAAVEARQAQKKAELAENDEKIRKEVEAHKLKLAEINTAEQDALNSANERLKLKLQNINTDYDKIVARENARHANEMVNIQLEIDKLREKASAILSQQSAVASSVPPVGGSDQSSGSNITSSDFDMEKYERDVGIATSNGVQEGITAGTQLSADEVKASVSKQIADGTREGWDAGVKVEGMPLEEWVAKGKEQGAAMGTAATEAVKEELKDFDITEDLTGVPVSVVINPATDKEAAPLIESIQAALENYPGQPTLDFDEAEKTLQNFVRDAQRKYRIEIPVSTSQGKATGGQVYPMAGGGKVPGTKSPKDKVNVVSRPGEWYIPDEQTSYWHKSVGNWFMNAVHKPMSQAGQYLKNSILQGPTSRAVPIPVPSQSGISNDVLSSLNNLGTLDAKIGEQVSRFIEAAQGGLSAASQPAYNITLNYSGSASNGSAKSMAKMVLDEIKKIHRGSS